MNERHHEPEHLPAITKASPLVGPDPDPKAALVGPARRFVPAVPVRVPLTGDSVRFVLKKLGAGAEHHPKIRPAVVTEAWDGSEKHPTDAWKVSKKKVGPQPYVSGPDGRAIIDDQGEPFVPVGLVNLEIHLDGHGRKDHNAGHDRYAGHVLYDPEKAPGTWHWAGE